MGKVYKETNDSELLFMVNEENEDAKDILYKKYYYIIEQAMRKYAKTIIKSGVEYKDVYQEAMLGFADALDKYNDSKETQLATFITLCVKRRLSNLLRAATSTKSKFNKDILSIDYDYENYDSTLIDIISDDNKYNPLINIATKENLEATINSCEAKLSPFETKVFDLMILEYDYKQIAAILKESPKKIDNTVQRIKRKIKDVIEVMQSNDQWNNYSYISCKLSPKNNLKIRIIIN